jgi:energy-coupling factor transporter ATP-binding protein EcfA2
VRDAILRLIQIDIQQFRSIEDQYIPAQGLVVLFGTNSAGKTSLLEAVENLITSAPSFRPDPGAEEDPFVLGSVIFDLPAANFAESEDARLYLAFLHGDYCKPGIFGEPPEYPWGWLDKERRAPLKNADLEQAKAMLADALARAGDAGSADDRGLLSRAVFDPAAAYFAADLTSISFNAYRPAMPAEVRMAARRIAGHTGTDPLWNIANNLMKDGRAHVAFVASGSFEWQEFTEAFPPVIVLDGDIESLSAELERAVVSIHDRLWEFDPTVEPPSGGPGRLVIGEDVSIGGWQPGSRFGADKWLEARSEDGNSVLPGIFAPYDQGDWFRVRHSILAAAELIEREANRIAPEFILNQGRIGIEVLPVSVWGTGTHRVRATFTEAADQKHDLRVVGAGTGRWSAAAIRLAARRLGKSQQVVVDENGVVVNDEDERRRVVSVALRTPLAQTLVRLEPSEAPAVYIVDEPEAHLHPSALQSVSAWLGELSRTAAMVIVATHSTALLDCQTEMIHRVHVQRSGQGTKLQLMTGKHTDELTRVSDEFGLTKGELLLLTRLALFVEGPNDEIILNEWFGNDLRSAGIRVFPVHGVDNLPGLITSDVVTALGIRIATLSDDTDPSRATSPDVRTTGEGAVARLLAEAKRAHVIVHITGLEQPDILYYLDETICRQAAPDFPGWSTAVSEWASEGRHGPWKRWVKKRYGVSTTRDGIRTLAQECRTQGKIPAEIARKIHGLIAYASDRAPASGQVPQG